MSRHFFIATGETSGETHAMGLCRAITRIDPETTFSAMGTSRMRDAGMEIVINTGGHQVMGFWEIIAHIPFFRRAATAILEHLDRRRPDAVILVDNPGFNLRLAAAIKKRMPGLPVIYYIAPKAWAWNEGRTRALRRQVDKVLCIFPFEPDWFAARGVTAIYVGNPTADAVRRTPDGTGLRRELGIRENEKLIAVFPGSRSTEIRRLLPVMLEAAGLVAVPGTRFAIAAAPGFSRQRLNQHAPLPESIPIVENRNLELMAAGNAILAKSGTTAMEAALLGKPMVVAYRSNWLSAIIARRVVKLDWFSLPNIIAGRKIVTELFQEQAIPERLAAELRLILTDPDLRARMEHDLEQVRRIVGEQPAADRAARAVMDFPAGSNQADFRPGSNPDVWR